MHVSVAYILITEKSTDITHYLLHFPLTLLHVLRSVFHFVFPLSLCLCGLD